jgi:hypothetical protein
VEHRVIGQIRNAAIANSRKFYEHYRFQCDAIVDIPFISWSMSQLFRYDDSSVPLDRIKDRGATSIYRQKVDPQSETGDECCFAEAINILGPQQGVTLPTWWDTFWLGLPLPMRGASCNTIRRLLFGARSHRLDALAQSLHRPIRASRRDPAKGWVVLLGAAG